MLKTCSTYFSCDTHNFLDLLSRIICMPRICFAGPRSFISKELDNSFFKFPIKETLCPTINISST
ncbi:hypothetical protein Syun_011832 [Stephania yunnanensis]|uniref:Uncharacterized protein n=1 Tax=Stephania yunnanensis TaxID=152371 RepID=A0AAP0PFU5_9MAGN